MIGIKYYNSESEVNKNFVEVYKKPLVGLNKNFILWMTLNFINFKINHIIFFYCQYMKYSETSIKFI